MSQKRKGKALLEKVAKLAKASEESEKFDREKSQYFQQMASEKILFFKSLFKKCCHISVFVDQFT